MNNELYHVARRQPSTAFHGLVDRRTMAAEDERLPLTGYALRRVEARLTPTGTPPRRNPGPAGVSCSWT